MKNLTLAQEAYKLLNPIPADQWITGSFSDKVGKCCAMGHYSRLASNNPSDYSIYNCMGLNDPMGFYSDHLREKSKDFLRNKGLDDLGDIANVNNDPSFHYPQKTPKERTLALLRDMVEAGL